MAGPGKGRYTSYVPVSSDRNTLLRKLFNNRAPNNAGVFYGDPEQTDNTKAAEAAVQRATAPNVNGVGGLIPSKGVQRGDISMFPEGVDLSFGKAPDISKVSWSATQDSTRFSFDGTVHDAGGPANPYTPDLSSPGPGKTNPLDKNANPNISIKDIKGETYIPGAPGTGTASPSTTSANVGITPIGADLEKGQSPVKKQ